MFTIDEDLSIYVTRGDAAYFSLTAADDNGEPYIFQSGDVVRIKVFVKKDCSNVVLEKYFPVTSDSEKVTIVLSKDDTKIGDIINKPKDYWYEIELNPLSDPKTIIGYGDEGPALFRLLPEGADEEVYTPTEEDIPIVDTSLSIASVRPVQNQAITRAIVKLNADLEESKKKTENDITNLNEALGNAKDEIATERARMDAAISEVSTDTEITDIRVDYKGVTHATAGNAVRSVGKMLAKLTGGTEIQFTQGGNISLGNVGVGNVASLVPDVSSGASTFSYAIVNCQQNDVFLINALGGANPRVYGFLDENNVIISMGENTERLNDAILHAPFGAAKLVINSQTASLGNCYRGVVKQQIEDIQNSLSGYVLTEIIFKQGCNIKLGIGIGGTVNLTPELVSNYECAIVPCKYGDTFTVSGEGGANPRLWGFIDSDNKLLSVADAGAYGKDIIITAPTSAAKLVINKISTYGDYMGLPCYIGSDLTSRIRTIFESVETLKNKDGWVLHQTGEDALLTTIRGTNFTKELVENKVADFEKPGDKMVHVSTFDIIDGYIYMTYYANTIDEEENPEKQTARLAYCDVSDTNNKTYIDLQSVGETYNEMKVSAVYDTILMRKNKELYLMWTAMLNGDYYRLYRIFNTETKEIGEVQINSFKVGNVTNDFCIPGMKDALNKNGIAHKPMTVDIGIMQKLSTRVENGVTYYYTGCYANAFNCIIKSSDLVTWEYVAAPTHLENGQFENAVYVLDDKVYYFLRQNWEENTGILCYYDLSTSQWSTPIYVDDCQSRADFFMFGGGLFLIHAPKDRNHLEVMEINRSYLNKTYAYQTAKVPDYFYPFVREIDGDLYISFTVSRKHIRLCKFTLNGYTADRMLSQLNTLFY